MTSIIETLHKDWYSLDASTDRDEIRTRWPELASTIDKLNRAVAIQYDAAAELVRAQSQEHREVEELVLGKAARDRGRRVEQYVKLGEDYVVLVAGGTFNGKSDTAVWTFTVRGKATEWYYADQEQAILHLIAARHDPNPNTNHMWAAAAARVLGLWEE